MLRVILFVLPLHRNQSQTKPRKVMKTVQISFERTETHLVMSVDGKVSKQWRLETMPKNDSLYVSPNDAIVEELEKQSRFGNVVQLTF